MGKRELVALLDLSSCCLVMVEGLFIGVPRGCPRFVIVVLPDHTHLLFLIHFDKLCKKFERRSGSDSKLFAKVITSSAVFFL